MSDILQEAYTLDVIPEDEYEGGGFNAVPDESFEPEKPEGTALEKEATPEETQDVTQEAKEKPAEATKPEPEPEAQAEAEKPADEPVKEPGPHKPDSRDQQFDFLLEQNARMQRELAELKKAREETPQVQRPTEEDFINDPAAAAEQLIEWRDQQKAQEQQTTQQAELKQAQKVSESTVAQAANGAFIHNRELNDLWNKAFPFFAGEPDGPMKAARMAAQIYEARHPSQPNQQPTTQEAPQDQPPQAAQAAREENAAALPAEPDRAAKLKKGVMHGSGQHSKPNVQQLDPQLVSLGTQYYGLTEEDLKAVM